VDAANSGFPQAAAHGGAPLSFLHYPIPEHGAGVLPDHALAALALELLAFMRAGASRAGSRARSSARGVGGQWVGEPAPTHPSCRACALATALPMPFRQHTTRRVRLGRCRCCQCSLGKSRPHFGTRAPSSVPPAPRPRPPAAAGELLYVHCGDGNGRTGTLVAVLLGLAHGISSAEALDLAQRSRNDRHSVGGSAPETQEQRSQVRARVRVHL